MTLVGADEFRYFMGIVMLHVEWTGRAMLNAISSDFIWLRRQRIEESGGYFGHAKVLPLSDLSTLRGTGQLVSQRREHATTFLALPARTASSITSIFVATT